MWWFGGRGRLYTYCYTVTTRMTSALRWAVMRAILMFHNCEGQSHKTVSTDHNLWSERRAEADLNQGPSAYQPNALLLDQTSSLSLHLTFLPPPYPFPSFSPSLISLTVSVDVKHHVYFGGLVYDSMVLCVASTTMGHLWVCLEHEKHGLCRTVRACLHFLCSEQNMTELWVLVTEPWVVRRWLSVTNPCPCQIKCFIFMLCIHNKDLFYHPIWSSGLSAGRWFALCRQAVLEDLDIPNILFGHATIYQVKSAFDNIFSFGGFEHP